MAKAKAAPDSPEEAPDNRLDDNFPKNTDDPEGKTVIKMSERQAPKWLTPEVRLTLDIIDDTRVEVEAVYNVEWNEKDHGSREGDDGGEYTPLVFDVDKSVEIASVEIDGVEVTDYNRDSKSITFNQAPTSGKFQVKFNSVINPKANTQGKGIYMSGDHKVSQCEAEEFRRIVPSIDRPDNMSEYWVTIRANKEDNPYILSNGDEVEGSRKDLEDGRHQVQYHDKHKKPSYLFGLAAGKFELVEDEYESTINGETTKIKIYCEKGDGDKCKYAIEALKKAMAWQEEVLGLAYDMKEYKIVVANDFNAGAMENKGLNIFNSKYVLLDPETATDTDYRNVLRVVAHEYFHNYFGNRVTLREWGELTLKEGLVVFLDSLFSEECTGPETIQRIRNIKGLKAAQYPEDEGSSAHSIRPQEFESVNNVFSSTIYRKGAEIHRMIRKLVGVKEYFKCLMHYVEHNDGQAVTSERFLESVKSQKPKLDFTQFIDSWYNQAGRPKCLVSSEYDATTKEYTLTIEQELPGEKDGEIAYFYPFEIGLVVDGKDIPLELKGGAGPHDLEAGVLHISEMKQEFVFCDVEEEPIVSLGRGFLPVDIEYDYSVNQLRELIKTDPDELNRYIASQNLGLMAINSLIDDGEIDEGIIAEYGKIIDRALLGGGKRPDEHKELMAEMLVLPNISDIARGRKEKDFEKAQKARDTLIETIAKKFEAKLEQIYFANEGSNHKEVLKDVGSRRLRSVVLAYLTNSGDNEKHMLRAKTQMMYAENMTDQFAAMAILADMDGEEAKEAVNSFYETWKDNKLVFNKWIEARVAANDDDILEVVEEIAALPEFDARNSNNLRMLYGGLAGNLPKMHAASGDSYRYIGEKVIELDKVNNAVAAFLMRAFAVCKNMDPARQSLIMEQVNLIHNTEGISGDVKEKTGQIIDAMRA